MLPRSAILGGALCLSAIIAGLATVGSLPRGASANRPVAPAQGAADDAASDADPVDEPVNGATPRSWLLSAGGWYIRVDDVEASGHEVPPEAPVIVHRPPARRAASISPFDQLIVHHATAEGFDWRLIAALIFEESRFDPTVESDKGAYGLMQVRPIAAHAVGTDRFRAPNDNLSAGVRYLRQLDEMFRDAPERDRMGLVLAAYNMGPGHVRDAQRLARRLRFDPNRWEGHMERILPLLELPAVYQRLPNGFAKGSDTVAYVQRTIERYHRYQRQSPDAAGMNAEALSSAVADAPAHG